FVANLEAEILTMAIQDTPNQTGNPAAAFNNIGWANIAKMQIENNGGHKGTKRMLMNPSGELQVIDSLKGLFNAQKQINVQYEEGEMGRAAGFDWSQTTVMPLQSRGTANANYDVNGANQTGASINVDTGTGTILKGEIVTFAGCVAVHPQTKLSLGYLKQFVVTEDFAGGTGALKVYPAIVTSGSEQNVTASPTDNGDVVVAGTASTPYGINLAYTKDAFTFGTVDLPDLPGFECSRRAYDGISMRVATGSDIVNDQVHMRFDIMAAFGSLRPEWASRVANDHTALTPA
ncbi:MAG: P22 phage major capsid protein family protein, partial [Beijerinckiaceae bacterium]